MGMNATVVICLDQLDSIMNSQDFGRVLAHCILDQSHGSKYPIYAPNGIAVVEVHHASSLVPVIVGGNTGRVIPKACIGINSDETVEETNFRMLKEIANVLGYRVSKIPQRKPVKTETAWDRMTARQRKIGYIK